MLPPNNRDDACRPPAPRSPLAMTAHPIAVEEYRPEQEPYYHPVGDEVALFEAAAAGHIPLLLKGPTGCGKTRFVEHMAWRLHRPLVTVSCHDDLTASDLVGRYLVKGGEVVWVDGPLTRAVKVGAICYLDEIVEARKDTTVVIHPLADDRRYLTVEKTGQVHPAHPDFCLVISYNPGYQSALKELKVSTRQRFASLAFDYPAPAVEAAVVAHETGLDPARCDQLVRLAQMTRNLKEQGLEEGASTRLLVHCGRLMVAGIDPVRACETAIALTLTDDPEMVAAVAEMVAAVF